MTWTAVTGLSLPPDSSVAQWRANDLDSRACVGPISACLGVQPRAMKLAANIRIDRCLLTGGSTIEDDAQDISPCRGASNPAGHRHRGNGGSAWARRARRDYLDTLLRGAYV